MVQRPPDCCHSYVAPWYSSLFASILQYEDMEDGSGDRWGISNDGSLDRVSLHTYVALLMKKGRTNSST